MKFWVTAPLGKGFCLGEATGLPPDSSLVHGADETWLQVAAAVAVLNTTFFPAVAVFRQNVRRGGRVGILLVPVKAICMGNTNLRPLLCLMVKANPTDCILKL